MLSAALVLLAGAVLAPSPASAGEAHPYLVRTDPQDATPDLVPSTAYRLPYVASIDELGDRMVAGGTFDTVRSAGSSQNLTRTHAVVFDKTTGEVSPTFAPQISGGAVFSVAADPATNSVYLGGDFRQVNGVARPTVAKLDATTGQLDPTFSPGFTSGRANDLDLVTIAGVSHLIVSGNPAKKITSVDPRTGRNDGYFDSAFGPKIPGTVDPNASVYQLDVDPSGTHAAAVGNFDLIDGQSRARFAMFDLGPDHATLSDWYYDGFQKLCASTRNDRIAYISAVDWSPDGTAFSLGSTGFKPASTRDIWYHYLGDNNRANTSVCDSVSRFQLADDSKPQWINYTGGDTVTSVDDTGSAVYGAGHFRWLDNPDGSDSRVGTRATGEQPVDRIGIGAIDPVTGLALSWNPGLSGSTYGGRSMLSTDQGLWLGNESFGYGGESHRGIVFAPLDGPVEDKVVWAVGDACRSSASGPRAADGCRQVAQLIAADPDTDAVLGLGDLQGGVGSAEDYANVFDPAMGSGAGLKNLFLPVPGGADYRTPDASGYFGYWGAQAGATGEGWYKKDLGGWRLIATNSRCDKIGTCSGGSPQGTFLRQQLQDSPSRCQLVFDYHAPFSDGTLGDHGWGKAIFRTGYNNGADLMLSARESSYQRFTGRNPDGNADANGVPTFVVGTGGLPATDWSNATQRSAYRQNTDLGALRLVLSDGAWTSEFVTVDGRVLDTASGGCRS